MESAHHQLAGTKEKKKKDFRLFFWKKNYNTLDYVPSKFGTWFRKTAAVFRFVFFSGL